MATTDEVNNYGIQTQDATTLLKNIQSDLTTIYSPDGQQLNFESNSPDGQFTQIITELGTVNREIATEVYNSTIPDNCNGAQQDKMYAINYLTRKAGSFTLQNISITATQPVTLDGLDGNYNDESASAYGVKDNAGNVYYLIDTTTLSVGTTSLPFRAQKMGEIIPTVNTLTTPLNIIRGITSVNNPTGYSAIGSSEETNNAFRIRRSQSVALASGNSVDSTESQLRALDGVISVQSWDNYTNETDDTNTPAHTTWYIVEGGSNTDIADVIYNNQGGGDTRGQVTVPIASISGQVVNVNFDRPTAVPLYIKFNALIKQNATIKTVNTTGVAQYLVQDLTYDIGQSAYSAELVELAQVALDTAGGNAYCTGLQITSDVMTGTLTPSSGLTATCDWWTFEQKFPYTNTAGTEGTYTFTGSYADDTITWNTNGGGYPSDFGITVTGTPSTSSVSIVVKYTAPIWQDVVNPSTLADQFVTDSTRVWITVVQPTGTSLDE
jgi:hypothetical protein